MKNILFVVYTLGVGGVEKALLNLISILPDNVSVTILTMEKKGELLNDLPDNVKVLESTIYKDIKWIINGNPYQVIKTLFIRKQIIFGIQFLFFTIYRNFTRDSLPLYKFLFRKEKNIAQLYDAAIAYAGPSGLIDFFTVKKIHSKKKIGWIHFDILKFGIDQGMTRQLYKIYNKIFVVSKVAKEHFDQIFPEFKNKTEIFYNVVSPIEVQKQADSDVSFDDNFSGKRILTVGRISPEKGQNYAIEALKILVEKGYPVKWYFVGDGHFRKECEELVMKYQLEEYVAFLGTKKNPYPYMKDCDIYVQPSRHEGYCITLAEAKVFGMPIVATDFVGAREQLMSRSNSVVTGFAATDLANGIIKIMESSTCKINGISDAKSSDIKLFMDLLEA